MEPTAVQEAVQMTWRQVAGFALGTGFFSALVAKVVEYVAWCLSRKARATRDALQIAVLLERFAARAAAQLEFNQTHVGVFGLNSRQCLKMEPPELDHFPDSISWVDIDKGLRSRAFGLLVERDMLFERLGYEDTFQSETFLERIQALRSVLGYHAFRCLMLAKDLRKKYGIETVSALGEETKIEDALSAIHRAALTKKGIGSQHLGAD